MKIVIEVDNGAVMAVYADYGRPDAPLQVFLVDRDVGESEEYAVEPWSAMDAELLEEVGKIGVAHR